ncbi:hypothetical protein WG906_16180 [Pedobacter sp. P351]|uniref:hypothetical protein n=1 Tax=Pedobacter superstes TaxID=3133441 RepID=UPI00309CE55E
MAILKNSLTGFRGNIDKVIVVKQQGCKTILTAYPDMSKVVYNEKQKAEQKRFSDAVQYAKSIVRNAKKKEEYEARIPKGKKVFNAAIAEYMSKTR